MRCRGAASVPDMVQSCACPVFGQGFPASSELVGATGRPSVEALAPESPEGTGANPSCSIVSE
eukprot:8879903-Pyramimonas_sp.AAC.1